MKDNPRDFQAAVWCCAYEQVSEPYRLAGCTCPPDHGKAWHYRNCPWAMR